MTQTARKNPHNVDALNGSSDVNNVGLSNPQPTFSEKRFLSGAGSGSNREKKGDSESLPRELMFDMMQDEVADLRNEIISLKVDISRLIQRVTFLFQFFDLQEVNATVNTAAATQVASESSVSTLLGGTSASNTIGTKTFANVIKDSIVTRTDQPLSACHPSITDVVYQPQTLLNKTIQGTVLSAVHGEMLSKEARRPSIIESCSHSIIIPVTQFSLMTSLRWSTGFYLKSVDRIGWVRSSTTASTLSTSHALTSLMPPTCWRTPSNCVNLSTTTSVVRYSSIDT